MPSNWAPSRRVVSKTSTAAGRAGVSEPVLVDMLQPVLVAVDLAPDGLGVLGGDGRGHGAGAGDVAVVDRVDGRDLGGRAADEHLLADVEVAAGEVVEAELEA